MSDKNPKRGIYLLPNLLTTAALFSGFFAILAAIDGHYDKAALAIFLAMLLDALDGRVARMTNTQTAFGAEYDSLSDMVAFGLAPGLVMYLWTLNSLGRLGWLVAFVYVTGAALRLARFNTKVETADKSYFEGLPSPAAAGVVVGCLWVAVDYDLSPDMLRIPVAILTAFAGLAMVSNLRYYSFKEIDFHGKVPYMLVVGVTLAAAVVITEPPLVLFTLFFLYTFSGLITTLRSRKKSAPPENS
jgi:CDP-diacylglycerol--serine O-phosphatidyltransferase